MKELNTLRISFLDRATSGLRWVAKPSRGWLRAVRQALGITHVALAKRLNVSASTSASYEEAELKDTATVGTLRRVAEALDCELVFAIIPRKGRSFAELAAENDPEAHRRRAVAHSMMLSGKHVEPPDVETSNSANAAVAVQALMNGYGLDQSTQLRLLRKVAEQALKPEKRKRRQR